MTRGPVPEFGEVRQSTVDPDNEVLVCIVDGLQEYFTKLLLRATFPDLCHKAVLQRRKVTPLVFKCVHDSIVGHLLDGEPTELSPHLVADCGQLWTDVVRATTAEQNTVTGLCLCCVSMPRNDVKYAYECMNPRVVLCAGTTVADTIPAPTKTEAR